MEQINDDDYYSGWNFVSFYIIIRLLLFFFFKISSFIMASTKNSKVVTKEINFLSLPT